jgi:hypothetical protein
MTANPNMADYYSVIAEAVSRLPANTGDARRELYERARRELAKYFKGQNPPQSEDYVARETLALEAAIRDVEDKSSSTTRTPDGLKHPLRTPVEVSDDLDQTKIDPKDYDELFQILKTVKSSEEGRKIVAHFHRQRPWLRVAIKAEAVRELYGGKQPTPNDGILGWVLNIEEQLVLAEAADRDIEVSLADWNANVAPEIAKKLDSNTRLRLDSVSAISGKRAIKAP